MDIHTKFELKRNELCDIMTKYGSDKGNHGVNNGIQWTHNYTCYYYDLFKDIRNKPLNIFELGLGTNNITITSNMGINGKPGASVKGWKEFFPKANIYGADIDWNILFEEERIQTYYCDQTNPHVIKNLWNTLKDIEFDIIIEDGLHLPSANICFFMNSFYKLKKDGVYVIEDIFNEKAMNLIIESISKVKDIEYLPLYLEPPIKNNHGNNILVIKRI